MTLRKLDIQPPKHTTPQGRTSMLGQMARGIGYDAPAGIGGLIDLLRKGSSLVSTGGLPADMPSAADAAKGMSEAAFGPDIAPETAGQRRARALTRGAALALPTLPLGGGAMSLGRVGLETLSGAAGELASTETEAAGGGTLAQLAAGIGAGSLPGIAAAIAKGPLTAMSTAAGGRIKDRTTRRLVAEVLGGEVKDRSRAIALIDQELDRPLFGTATTTQTIGDIAPGLAKIEKRVSRDTVAGASLRTEMQALRESNARAAQAMAEQRFAGTHPGAALADFSRKAAKIASKVRRAYANFQDLAGVPTSKLKATAARIRLEAGEELAEHLPKRTLKVVEQYGDTVNLQNVKRLRTAIGERLRQIDRNPLGDLQEKRFLNMLADGVEETFSEVAEAGGARAINALNRARNMRRLQAERFDPTDPLNKILGGEYDNMSVAFRKFLDSKTPVRDLQTLKLTLGDNPEAWGGVQRLMSDEVFGEGFERLTNDASLLSKGGAKAILGKLKRNRSAFDVAFGEGAADNAQTFLERARKLSEGVVGTQAEAAVTGSNISADAPEIVSVVADVAQGNLASAATKAWYAVRGQLPGTREEIDTLLAAALVDPSVARGFLETLPPTAIPRWKRSVEAAITRPTRVGVGMEIRYDEGSIR